MVLTRSQQDNFEALNQEDEMSKEHNLRTRKRKGDEEIASRSSMDEVLHKKTKTMNISQDEDEESKIERIENLENEVQHLHQRLNEISLEIINIREKNEDYKKNNNISNPCSSKDVMVLDHDDDDKSDEESYDEDNDKDPDYNVEDDVQVDDNEVPTTNKPTTTSKVATSKPTTSKVAEFSPHDDEWSLPNFIECLINKKLEAYSVRPNQSGLLKGPGNEDKSEVYYTLQLNEYNWCLCVPCFNANRSPQQCIKIDQRGIQAHKKPGPDNKDASCAAPFKRATWADVTGFGRINGDTRKLVEGPDKDFIYFRYPFQYNIACKGTRMEMKTSGKYAGMTRFKHSYLGELEDIEDGCAQEDIHGWFKEWLKRYIWKENWDKCLRKNLPVGKNEFLIRFGVKIVKNEPNDFLPNTPDLEDVM